MQYQSFAKPVLMLTYGSPHQEAHKAAGINELKIIIKVTCFCNEIGKILMTT